MKNRLFYHLALQRGGRSRDDAHLNKLTDMTSLARENNGLILRRTAEHFILAALGALAGSALASATSAGRDNVFLAYSWWKSHTRGWLRTLVEFFEIVFAFCAAVVFIAMLVMFIAGKMGHSYSASSQYLLASVCSVGFGTAVIALLSIIIYISECPIEHHNKQLTSSQKIRIKD